MFYPLSIVFMIIWFCITIFTSDIVVESEIAFFYGFYVLYDDRISRDGICVDLNYELRFLTRGLGLVYR